MGIRDIIARYQLNNTPSQYTKSRGVGELAALDKNPFSSETLKYPLEGIGLNDVPHYVLFNINIPTSSKYLTSNPGQADTGISASTADYSFLSGHKLTSASGTGDSPVTDAASVSALLNVVQQKTINPLNIDVGSAGAAFIGGGVAGQIASQISIQPQLKRIKTSIALYMPESQLQAEYNHAWGGINLTDALGKVGIAAAYGPELRSVGNAIKYAAENAVKHPVKSAKHLVNVGNYLFNGHLHNSGPLSGGRGAELYGNIAEATGIVGAGAKDLLLRTVNRAINPQVQMVFSGTANREYIFEFNFQARSNKEAQEVYKIIRAFKSFAAPEIANEGAGRYFIPPAQFDIKFYFKGEENPVIAKISTCALVRVTVNYNATEPFTTFADGMPIHISLQLQFREMDIISRDLITEFDY